MDVRQLAVAAQLIIDVHLGRGVAVHQILLPVYLHAQVVHRPDCAAAALQGFAKRRAELAVEVRVDERVQGAVEISHPKNRRHHDLAALARVAQRRDEVPA